MVVLIIPMIRFNAHSFTCVYHLINWKLLCIYHALTCLSCTHLFYMPLHEHTGVCGCLDMYMYLFRYRSSMCTYVSVGVVVDVSMCMSHWVVYAFVSSSLFVFDDTCSLVCSKFNKGSRFMGDCAGSRSGRQCTSAQGNTRTVNKYRDQGLYELLYSHKTAGSDQSPVS